jgi:excisionase family DNA binding protein
MYAPEAMEVMGCGYKKLQRLVRKGEIRAVNDGKRWIFNDEDIWKKVGKVAPAGQQWMAFYCRVGGTTESDRRLMQQQQELMRQWATAKGLEINWLYEDWAPSTEYSIEERPGLHQMLQDIIHKRVKVIVVESPDRLARIGRELIEVLCTYYGVNLVYCNTVISRPEYLDEQAGEIARLLEKAGVDRLGARGRELPKVNKPKLKHPGKIVSDWEGQPLPPTSRDLSDLI